MPGRFGLLAFCISLVLVALLLTRPALGSMSAPCGSGWSVLTSPDSTNSNAFKAVSGTSPSDAWAVGDDTAASPPSLITRLTPSGWIRVAGPSEAGELYGVVDVAPGDAWAVGSGPNWALHWDGTSWSLASVPSAEGPFLGVAAGAPGDVWAVGANGYATPVTAHWDGVSWSLVPTPSLGSIGVLNGVAVLSATDVWAVGYVRMKRIDHPLFEHWDGARWTATVQPGIAGPLNGVAAVSTNDVWAVGVRSGSSLIEHWDGSAWTASSFQVSGGWLQGVTGVSSNEAWAVGWQPGGSQALWATLVQRWNGSTWSTVRSANPDDSNFLAAIDVAGPLRLAVGDQTGSSSGDYDHTLAEVSCAP